MDIKEVYEKWKHCDRLFSDKKWLSVNWQGEVLYDLWQAIKEHCEEGKIKGGKKC